MNIGFYRYSLYNRGGDRLSLEYANHLSRRGHQVTQYVSDLNTIFTLDPDIELQRLPVQSVAGFLMHTATSKLGHDLVVVDIIHLAALLSRHNQVVYYAQADDVEYYKNPLLRQLIHQLYRFESRSGRPIISMSQHLTDIFAKRYFFSRVHTLHTGIEQARFYPEPDAALLEDKGGKKAIVFMDRGDVYRKGRDIGASMLAKIGGTSSENVEVWVCGDRLNLGIPGLTVRNFGTVSDDRLRQILSSADIFLYPSRHEGFGLFPLEAMACGCVAVTSEAIPYARETECILSSPVDNNEAMEINLQKLITDTAFLESLKRQAQVAAKTYDFETTKLEFESTLEIIKAWHDANRD